MGPFDLGNNIGHPIIDGKMSPELVATVDRILEVGHKANKKVGFFASNGKQAREYAEKGFDSKFWHLMSNNGYMLILASSDQHRFGCNCSSGNHGS